MDRSEEYRTIVKEILTEIASYTPSNDDVEALS